VLHGCHTHFADRNLKKYENKMVSSSIILTINSMINTKPVQKLKIPIFWDNAMRNGTQARMFQRSLLPPPSGKSKVDIISQKTETFTTQL
jgi:hypothetical protein